MDEFTSEEYIAQYGLGISVNDPDAMALLNEHLLKKGYSKMRMRKYGKQQMVWSKVAREEKLQALRDKLRSLE